MHRWKYSVLATAATLSAGFHANNALALALGRVNVQSALGEPLRAEIDLPQITTAEADSLAVELASPEVFRAQGMEYSPAVHNVRVRIGNRPDGSLVLLLSSDRPVNEPFVDLVIDASSSSGNITRSYTMLFDPPNIPRSEAVVNTPARVGGGGGNISYGVTPTAPSRPAPIASAPPASPSSLQTGSASDFPGDQVSVRAGDTAGRIARTHKPTSVSLDQMLVAMARANPHAFIKGNVNRLRAGVVLQMPSEAEALATPAAEARKLIAVQSRDFNAYRQSLAGNAPVANITPSKRTDSGSIETKVTESKPAPRSPDQLKLDVPGNNAADDAAKIAADRQREEEANRIKELEQNLKDLNTIDSATTVPNPTPPTEASPSDIGLEITPPEGLGLPADLEPPPEPIPAPEPEPEPAPAPPPPPPPPKPAPYTPPPEPSLVDTLTEDPLMAGGALAVVLGLLGFGGWRFMQKRREQEVLDDESSFFRSAVGSQQIDSEQSNLTTTDDGSSVMSYSPSQLDAGGDVDPVAEADVYLAYGRDVQAEEILKEATRLHPDRVAIPAKLAEIYAKRQDTVALETVASEVYSLTGGVGPEWSRVCELGRDVDPENTLYQAGKSAASPAAASPPPVAFASTEPAPIISPPSAGQSVLPDLDLDLDTGLSAGLPDTASPVEPAAAPILDLPLQATASAPPAEEAAPPMDFQISGISLMDSAEVPATPASSAPTPTPTTGAASLEFSISDLSLDLDVPSTAAPAESDSVQPAAQPEEDDPLATKLALAEEFSAIGDYDGARSMVEEVIAEATGELRARAQRLLAQMA